jgi:hypothetical protein
MEQHQHSIETLNEKSEEVREADNKVSVIDGRLRERGVKIAQVQDELARLEGAQHADEEEHEKAANAASTLRRMVTGYCQAYNLDLPEALQPANMIKVEPTGFCAGVGCGQPIAPRDGLGRGFVHTQTGAAECFPGDPLHVADPRPPSGVDALVAAGNPNGTKP